MRLTIAGSTRIRVALGWIPLVIGLIVLTQSGLILDRAQAQKKARGTPTHSAGGSGSLKVITGHTGSVVFINDIRHGITSDDGVLFLPHIKAGSYSIRVRTTGYEDWLGRIRIVPSSNRVLKIAQQPTPDKALIAYQKGEELRDRGENEEAIKHYQSALQQRPALVQARIGMARSLILLQKFDEAEKQIEAALRQAGRREAEAHTVLANLRRQQGLIEEAIMEYRKALRLARDFSPEAHIGLALALEEAGQTQEAIKHYRIGISQDMDTEPILYYLLGNTLEKHRRNKEAIEAYQNYLRLDPQGQYASAVESIIERLKKEPN
jgi:Flp pilus assembly protein TadD